MENINNITYKNDLQKNIDCNLAGIDLVLLSTLVSITLSQDLTINQINILSNFLQSVGENLSIIATSRDICENEN